MYCHGDAYTNYFYFLHKQNTILFKLRFPFIYYTSTIFLLGIFLPLLVGVESISGFIFFDGLYPSLSESGDIFAFLADDVGVIFDDWTSGDAALLFANV